MSDDRWKRGVPPKVLVIGGSMAGLFASLLLRREGWDVDVYERIGAELAGRGAGIVTHSELFDDLARAGIDTAAAAVGVVVPGRRVLDRSGRIAGELALRQVLTSWGHLYGLLKAALPAQHYHHGKNLEGVTEFGDRVVARFSDGTEASGDLLVGADTSYADISYAEGQPWRTRRGSIGRTGSGVASSSRRRAPRRRWRASRPSCGRRPAR